MSELKRWAEDGASDEVRSLLTAAGAEQPSRSSLGRALSAVAAGVAVTAGSATASGAGIGVGTKFAALAGDVVVRWVVATTVATTGGAAAVALFHEPAPRSAPVRHAPVVKSAPAPLAPPPPLAVIPSTTISAEAPVPADPPAPHAVVSPPASSADPADPLAEELSFVDGARGALSAGQPLVALQALDRYDARSPRRGFASEALYLRMRALLALGRSEEARAVAARLSSSYPNSPQAARARQVLAGDDSVIQP